MKKATTPPNSPKGTRLIDAEVLDELQRDAFRDFVTDVGGITELGTLAAPLHPQKVDPRSAARFIRSILNGNGDLPLDKLSIYAKATSRITGKDFHELNQEIIVQKHYVPNTRKLKAAYAPELDQFCEFFGHSTLNPDKPVQLCFSKRVLDEDLEKKLKKPPFVVEPDCTFFIGNDEREDVWPEGGSGYISFETVIGAIQLASLFTDKTKLDPWVRQENAMALHDAVDSCVISFGLGFSTVTRVAQRHFNPPLFQVYCGESPKKRFRLRHALTDHFSFQRTITNPNGKIEQRCDKIDVPNNIDIALIVRAMMREPSDAVPPEPWFICAGRTTAGTAAAALYLKHYWQDLHKLYCEYDKDPAIDSLAVVIQHKDAAHPEYYFKSRSVEPPQDSIKLHCWHNDPDQRCIAFSTWSKNVIAANDFPK